LGPPDAVLNLILGEVAQVVATGQKVLPKKALELGYTYKHSDVLEALKSIFNPAKPVEKPAEPHHAHAAGHH
jgi:NAD dependent epimerase/dehydratase family enzyme